MTKAELIYALCFIKMPPSEDQSALFQRIGDLVVESRGIGSLIFQETVISLVISALPLEDHLLVARGKG